MNQDPKGTVFVRTDVDPIQCPVCQALDSLGYDTFPWALNERISETNNAVTAVFLSSLDYDDVAALERAVVQTREATDAPILLLDHSLNSEACAVPDLALGVTRIQHRPSKEFLQQAMTSAFTFQSLYPQLAHYRELLKSAPIGVFEITDGRVTYANDHLLQRVGYDLSELRGIELERLFAPSDRPRFRQALKDLPSRPLNAPPNRYKLLASGDRVVIGEIRSQIISQEGVQVIEGTIRDITEETRIEQLHRIVLELTEVILAEQDIDRILQLVLDMIVEYSGFARAVLSLYDLSIPDPFEGPVHKIVASGLTAEEQRIIRSQVPVTIDERRQVFSNEYALGPAQYIPHDSVPWSGTVGISGTVAIEGWHPDDYLFIPLRGSAGIIGAISVDDPIDHSVPSIASIEPVAFLARFAAIAVERVYKLNRLKRQAEQLHGLSVLGRELSVANDERTLCEIAANRVCQDMDFDMCNVWLHDGSRLIVEAVTQNGAFLEGELPEKGTRHHAHGPGITRLAFQNAELVNIPNVLQDSRYNGTRDSIRSFLSLPILGRKSTLGVINVASPRLSAFGNQDEEILTALASQLATTIAGLRRRSSLSRIYEFGQHLAVASTEKQAIDSTLELLLSQFDFHISSILLMDSDETLRIAGFHGPYEQDALFPGYTLGLGDGIAGQAALTRRFVIVPDVRKDPHYIRVSDGTRSELAVPILFSGNLLGVINTESPTIDYYDDEDRRLIEVVATHLAIALSNISSQADLREQAIRDPLTGLFNRHYFNSIIASEISRSDRYARPLSLMMLDVDGFRAVNNRMGHLTGDLVLQNVANLLSTAVRDSDRVIRYGGDEFLILMPETNGHGAALVIADRLRERIDVVLDGTDAEQIGVALGLSIGIYSRVPGDSKSLEEILEEVDRRMYADKRERNKDRADDYRY
jgi:diguanylate cyclase (GGDEF)-like protein/PAS domain S-box-containing protein